MEIFLLYKKISNNDNKNIFHYYRFKIQEMNKIFYCKIIKNYVHYYIKFRFYSFIATEQAHINKTKFLSYLWLFDFHLYLKEHHFPKWEEGMLFEPC